MVRILWGGLNIDGEQEGTCLKSFCSKEEEEEGEQVEKQE